MHRNLIETVMGAVVLLVAGLFVVFAYAQADFRAGGGYDVYAKFDKVTGLGSGADVRISGIKVGTVVGQELEPSTFLARVRMRIDSHIKLPTDTAAHIVAEGLLGGYSLSLIPGADETSIPAGGTINFTQSAVDLVQLLSKFVFSAGESAGQPGGAAAPKP